jgi:hypothetical protein
MYACMYVFLQHLHALAFFAVELADARPVALLSLASSAVVLADARPATLLATASFAVVLADARPFLSHSLSLSLHSMWLRKAVSHFNIFTCLFTVSVPLWWGGEVLLSLSVYY